MSRSTNTSPEGEGRFEGWYHYLIRKHFKRQKQHSRKKQAKTLIKERISIIERPSIVDERGRFGDWESDQMQFKRQRERVSIQYERKAMAIRMHKVADKTAEENEQAIAKTLEALPVDQGVRA